MGLSILQYADVEVAYDDPERIGRLVGLVDRLADEGTVVCGAGDDLGPGVLSTLSEGRQALDFFEGVGADVDTFGNHDFDHGVDPLLSVVEDFPGTWVCANAYRNGSRFGSAEGVEPWTILEAGAYRVGVVGVAHPETAEINPSAGDVRFTDPVEAVEEGIESLEGRGVDRTVVVSHWGEDDPIARTTDADLVLGGHDHERRTERIDGTLVCRPGGTARHLLAVDFEGENASATHYSVEDRPLDGSVSGTLHERIAAAGLDDVVGIVEDPIPCDVVACKRAESRIGNLVTDAYRWRTEADVAINSGGGFRRRDPLGGEVTAFDLVGITPFDSDLVVVELDGERLRKTLAHLAFVQAPDDLPAWHFGHVSGASVVWDDAAGELRSASVDGAAIDPDADYELATTEFFLGHDGLFPAFGPGDVVERFEPQYEAVVEYAREEGIDPRIEGRVQRPTLDPGDVPERDWPHSP